jgi:ABC-type sugar transport system permease subunit/ABC-type glycerol-3-phosphate transport system substrate-binding protein
MKCALPRLLRKKSLELSQLDKGTTSLPPGHALSSPLRLLNQALVGSGQATAADRLPSAKEEPVLSRRTIQRLADSPIISLFFLLVAVSFFSACSHAQTRVTLRLTDWADLDEIPLDREALAEFRRLHPAIDVLYEPNPGRQYEEKILTALAADEPPDVFLLDSKLIPTFTNKKILLDLAPYIRELGIDTSQWYPNVLNIARSRDALFAFPKGFTPLMMFFNKKLFDDANLPYPSSMWTWDDYLTLAKKMTKDIDNDGTPDQFGTTFTNYFYFWIAWVWRAGGDVVNPSGALATGSLNSPSTEGALSFLVDLRNAHRVAPNTGSWIQSEKTGTNVQLFMNGKIAMMVDGHWRLPSILRQLGVKDLRVGVVSLPNRPGGAKSNVMYESGWCVPVNSRHPHEAALLAAFMAGEKANRIRASKRLEIPSVRVVAEEFVASDSLGLECPFVEEIPFCRQPWGSVIERFSEIEWTLQDAVDEVMVNGKAMHETMTRYAATIDHQLETIREHQSYEFKPIREHSDILRFFVVVVAFVILMSSVTYMRAKGKARSRTKTAIGFLAPSLLHLTVFVFTPIAFAAYLSLHRWDVVVPDKPFVGLANFREIATDAAFWRALGNTIIYTLNVPIAMAISLGVALMMNRRLKGVAFLRALYFLPSVTSFVAIALVWMWIYHPTFGVANFVLGLAGVPPLQWLNATDTAMISVIIFSVWLSLGYQMVVFLAGLQGIPEEFHDAARIDGASNWQRFWRITLPLLKPTTFFILVTSVISSFQVFTSIYVMTGGGPVGSTDVIVYHIYQAAWEQLRMGYASAMSWVLFVIILIATWIQFKIIGRETEYG